jgi:hypothetical protein
MTIQSRTRSRASADETPDSRQHDASAYRSAELRHIDDAIKQVTIFKSLGSEPNRTCPDARRAARNLTEMLDDARKLHGLTKVAIARKVWKGQKPDKNFDRVTLSRKDNPTDRPDKSLRKHPIKYARVAEELANQLGDRVSGWSRNEALVRLFRGTEIDRKLDQIIKGRASRVSDPASCWHDLAEMFDALSQTVSRRYDLPNHFKRIWQTPGRYNLASKAITPSSFDIISGGDRLLHYGPLANDFAFWEEFPPIPSVPLFDECLAGPFSHMLELTDELSGQISPLDVTVQVWREMRFAVGPANSIERAGSLFEVRTRVDLASENVEVKLARPWLFLNQQENVLITVDGREFKTSIDLSSHTQDGRSWKDLLAWKGLGFQNSDLQPEHSYAAWRPVTSEACAEILGCSTGLGGAEFAFYGYDGRSEPTQTPENTFGAVVERALRTTGEGSLAEALFSDAETLVGLVEEEVQRRRREAMKLNDQALANWRQS